MARDACGGPLQALLMSEANGQAVLPAVWAACKEGVTHGLVLLYEQDPQNISRVLDVCQVRRDKAPACACANLYCAESLLPYPRL